MTVDLGNLAQHDPLALEIKQRVLAHLPDSPADRALSCMWGTIVIVRRQDGAYVRPGLRELTLRFDYGRLVVHDGRVGRPDISLWGTDAQVLELGELGQRRHEAKRPGLWRPTARAWSVGRLISGVSRTAPGGERLEIFGAFSHPRLLYRLSLVLSVVSPLHGPPPGERV